MLPSLVNYELTLSFVMCFFLSLFCSFLVVLLLVS